MMPTFTSPKWLTGPTNSRISEPECVTSKNGRGALPVATLRAWSNTTGRIQ